MYPVLTTINLHRNRSRSEQQISFRPAAKTPGMKGIDSPAVKDTHMTHQTVPFSYIKARGNP